MFKKKLVAMGLVAAMLGSLVACGDKQGENTDTPQASAGTATKAPAPNNDKNALAELKSGADDHSSIADGSIITFEDGLYEFAKYNDADWAGDKDAVVSIQTKLDSQVLHVTRPNGNTPAIAVDLISLLGDNYDKCAKVSVDIGVDCQDGFSAMSGSLVVFAGSADTECATSWSIYKADASSKTVVVDLGGNVLDPDASNYLTLADIDDSAASPSSVFIDNIICYDASGNALALNSAAEFAVDGVGEYDWSNAVSKPEDEVLLFTGKETGTGWWPENANSIVFNGVEGYGASIDRDKFDFGPGDVLTIYYKVADPEVDLATTDSPYFCVPYLRMQCWGTDLEDGTKYIPEEWPSGIVDVTWSQVYVGDEYLTDPSRAFYYDNATDSGVGLDEEDNTPAETVMINNSYTIVQYPFEFIVDSANATSGIFEAGELTAEDIFKLCDFCGIADRSIKLKINAVTIGKATN